MSVFAWLILFVIGTAFGSFLNVVSLRYSPEDRLLFSRRIGGRSRCARCQKVLAWYELIPLLSFCIQRGRCRGCKASLSFQYPIVELVSGLLFAYIPYVLARATFFFSMPLWTWWVASIIWITVAMALLLVFIIDRRYFIIPNGLALSIFILGAVWVAYVYATGISGDVSSGSFLGTFSGMFPLFDSVALNRIAGCIGGGLLFLLLVIGSRGRAMGLGDVKLIAGIGLLFGWPDIGVIIVLSFVIGALFSGWLMMRGVRKLSDRVPFGPFIVIASAITFFFGVGLIRGYFGILGM
ncbi:MAG: prepilin peptidase [Candidatus Pacebacteria bacterium]|nr:prepilin peptidase [Candidatus Paceibacterota bacterium]